MTDTNTVPNSLEYAIVGDFLDESIGPANMRKFVRERGLKSEHFGNNTVRTIFNLLMEDETDNIPLLKNKLIERVSSKTVCDAIEHSDKTILDAEMNVKQLAQAGFCSAARQIVADTTAQFGKNGTPSFIATTICERLKRELSGVNFKAKGYKLSELANPLPEDDDPDCLFRGRYLNKGGVLVLASVSGSGKSVISMQLAYAWAHGDSAFGITPVRKLRIGIFQTEDDDLELADFRDSMRQGFERFYGWTEADWREAEQNIVLHPTDGKTGEQFVALLGEVQASEHYDLVIINPLQGVTGFDISQNANLSKFLRNDIDGVIRRNEATKCGLLIIHHTNKPPSARDRAGFGTDRYAEYVGAGGAEITNVMRAMLVIMPTSEPGQYYLVAAKRGPRLGWPDLPGVKTALPTKIIRHTDRSEHIMFWQEVPGGAIKEEGPRDKGDPEVDASRVATYLKDDAKTLTDARKFAKELLGRKRGELAYDEIIKNLSKYEVVIKPTGSANRNIIGSQEGVEAAYKKQKQLEAEKLQAKIDALNAKKSKQ